MRRGVMRSLSRQRALLAFIWALRPTKTLLSTSLSRAPSLKLPIPKRICSDCIPIVAWKYELKILCTLHLLQAVRRRNFTTIHETSAPTCISFMLEWLSRKRNWWNFPVAKQVEPPPGLMKKCHFQGFLLCWLRLYKNTTPSRRYLLPIMELYLLCSVPITPICIK